MTKIIFTDHQGKEHVVDAVDGKSLMLAATKNDVHGIDADFGGCCSCATCGVVVHPEWFEKVGSPSEIEKSMLECSDAIGPTSRLSCQIEVSPALEGLRVNTPEHLYYRRLLLSLRV